MEIRPEIDLMPRVETRERNWAPLAIAAGVVIVVAIALVLILERGHKPVAVTPVSAAPLQPGNQRDFRFIFDAVSRDWDGAYPEIRIIHVDSK